MEKIGDFFALTWLIFAGPVTYIKTIFGDCIALFCSQHLYFGINLYINGLASSF